MCIRDSRIPAGGHGGRRDRLRHQYRAVRKALMLEKLCGNEALKENLSAALAAGRLPHSVLLCGAGGLGKNFAARLLAADYRWV